MKYMYNLEFDSRVSGFGSAEFSYECVEVVKKRWVRALTTPVAWGVGISIEAFLVVN